MTHITSDRSNLPRFLAEGWRHQKPALLTALALTLTAAFSLAAEGAAGKAQGNRAGAGRIVAAGGAITEILFALGLGERIVGVDTTSLFPAAAKEKPNVGYVRALSAEGVLSLRPSLVIAIDGAGPPDVVKLIEEAGVAVARIPDDPTPHGSLAKIEAVGSLAGGEDAAARLADEVRARFAVLAAARERIGTPLRAMFVMSLASGRPLVAGRGTAADGIIRLAGAENVVIEFDGYKPMTDEAVVAAAPDIVVMMNRGGEAARADEAFASPALAATPAARNGRFVAMDGLYLLGFGPRTPEAARDLMRAFYPDLEVPPLATGGIRNRP